MHSADPIEQMSKLRPMEKWGPREGLMGGWNGY